MPTLDFKMAERVGFEPTEACHLLSNGASRGHYRTGVPAELHGDVRCLRRGAMACRRWPDPSGEVERGRNTPPPRGRRWRANPTRRTAGSSQRSWPQFPAEPPSAGASKGPRRGLISPGRARPLTARPPFRSPHHSVSRAGLTLGQWSPERGRPSPRPRSDTAALRRTSACPTSPSSGSPTGPSRRHASASGRRSAMPGSSSRHGG